MVKKICVRGTFATAASPRVDHGRCSLISGHLNKQTAADLGTVEKTIKVHRARVMEKMKVHSVAELVHLAERAGVGGSNQSSVISDQ